MNYDLMQPTTPVVRESDGIEFLATAPPTLTLAADGTTFTATATGPDGSPAMNVPLVWTTTAGILSETETVTGFDGRCIVTVSEPTEVTVSSPYAKSVTS